MHGIIHLSVIVAGEAVVQEVGGVNIAQVIVYLLMEVLSLPKQRMQRLIQLHAGGVEYQCIITPMLQTLNFSLKILLSTLLALSTNSSSVSFGCGSPTPLLTAEINSSLVAY